MKQPRLPYGARSEEEMQRNLARLGTRWQERPLSDEERLANALATACDAAWWRGWWWGWFWGSWT
jgi:hypothetical protein